MKKIFSVLMVAVALMMAAPAQAQLIKFGVKGGLNMSKLDLNVEKLEDLGDNSTGFFIGPMAEVTLPIIGLGVDGALLYSQRGKGEYKEQGIEVPVNLKYTIGLGSTLGFYLAAGPDFFFNFKDIDVENVECDWKYVNSMMKINANKVELMGGSFSGGCSYDMNQQSGDFIGSCENLFFPEKFRQ